MCEKNLLFVQLHFTKTDLKRNLQCENVFKKSDP
jgi:hypothetical protein